MEHLCLLLLTSARLILLTVFVFETWPDVTDRNPMLEIHYGLKGSRWTLHSSYKTKFGLPYLSRQLGDARRT